jgi:N-acetylglucosaminyl-diphospho-decaprenol L-rhamnosyltransferase
MRVPATQARHAIHAAVQRCTLSVIVVTWNAADVLGACLDSLERQHVEGGFEAIVVDSGSTDATGELLAGREGIRTITKNANVGFSAGNNEAARVARGEVLLFLNSDTVVLEPGTLQTLADVARRPDVGLVGPRLENPDGSLQPSCAAHLRLRHALIVAGGLHRLLPDRVRARLAPDRWSHRHARDTDWLMGAAIAVRAELFSELGGFWPTMYAEDMDLAYRVARRGLRVRYEPSARVMHIGNHSLRQRWSDAERGARVAAAEVAFAHTHLGLSHALAIRAVLAAGSGARVVAHRLLGHREAARLFAAMARVYVAGRRASGSRAAS